MQVRLEDILGGGIRHEKLMVRLRNEWIEREVGKQNLDPHLQDQILWVKEVRKECVSGREGIRLFGAR